MPDDSDKLNNEAMYGGKQVDAGLKEPRRHWVFHRVFVSRDPHHRADNVGGNWYENRQPVRRRTVSEHRRRRTISSRSDIRYLSVEIVGEGLSRKPRVSDRCAISTSAQSIVDDTPQRRLVAPSLHPRPPEMFPL